MRANDVLGIIHAQVYDSTVRQLTSIRTMASVPFGCRYRFVDFPLSNMVNAGVTSVGIVTKDNYQSLMDHVGSGKPWDLARKRDGIFLLPPYNTSVVTPGTRDNRVESLYSNMDFLNHAHQEYVIMTDANSVYNIDFNDLFAKHTESGADITVVYKHGKVPAIFNSMVLTMDENKRVTDIAVLDESDGQEADYSFNIFLMRKSLLEYLIKSAVAHNQTSFSRDILQANVNGLKIVGYEATGFAEIIDSMQTYYDVSMALLDPANRTALFNEESPIATKISDNVPTLYGPDGKASNSLLADGCDIQGTVKNSLLFRGVVVEKGAVVENSILMQGTVVHANAKLNSVITDKDVTITAGRNLSGDPSYPIYFTKGIVV